MMKNNMEHLTARYDLMVCGGGIPGICAAITAARCGLKVALAEQRPILGGNSSSLALVPPHGAAAMWHNRMAREGGILEELLMEYAARSPHADNRRIWDLILAEWCAREGVLDLYMNTRLEGAEANGNRIHAVQLTQHSTERVITIHADQFVDATGDAYLADAVGAELRIGREGKKELGETLAPEEGDDKTLPSALYVIAHRRNRPVTFLPPPGTPRKNCDAFPHRPHVVDKFSLDKALTEDASAIQLFWWFSLGGERDTIKDSESIYEDLMSEAMGVWDHLKNHCTVETREALANYEAVWWSPFPLRRESRRVLGDYLLVEDDIFQPKLFEDRVGYGGWPVDIHPPEGIYSKKPPCDQTFVNELYSIPFRMMYSKNISNLMLAGRCVSASHVAMGSIRVMNSLGTAAQAVGMAAVLCKKYKAAPRDIAVNYVTELQQELLKADIHIIRMQNSDQADLARSATVSANSDLTARADQQDGWLELTYDLAQQIPVTEGMIKSLSLPLKSERGKPASIRVNLYLSRKLARFDSHDPVASTTLDLAAADETWLDWPLDLHVPADQLLWITIERAPGVFWGYQAEEMFGSRFAARFHGVLEPRPHHGCAQIAPVTDDWFPINHNGRLPHELHNWIGGTVGMQFDRKVRATLGHRLTPMQRPYQAQNATNGISRAEDWPNIWISDPDQDQPPSLSLAWKSPQEIREIRLTFDTDLDAPDRCYGWPREAHRFLFPVPECVCDYRVHKRLGDKWTELLSISGNYNRHRIHLLDAPLQCDAIQIEVLGSHGTSAARIYEVRVY